MLAASKSGAEVFSAKFLRAMKAEQQRRRGRGPQKAPKKLVITARFRPEVLQYFRSQGPGWQTRMDEALFALVQRRTKAGAKGRRAAVR
jgi:uncharacterized protein (DUF4415 family)